MAAAVELEPEESPLDQLFSDLLCSTVETVAVCMTAESARRKCDWRALASVLGFSGRQVTLLQQDKREPCKGRQLVNVWEDLGKASLRKFIYALKEAHMEECYRTITQDPYLEDVDFESVLKDYRQLKEDNLLRKECFPLIPMKKFQDVFYPHVAMPSPFSPAFSCDQVERENLKKFENCALTNDSAPVPDPTMEPDPNSVFVSYCPESGITNRKFNNQLRRFAEFIQNQGFTLHFEPNSQAEVRYYGGPATWKEACIKRSKNIVVVCTPEYFREDSKATQDVRRRSASKIEVDSRLLRQLVYQDCTRVIPVVLDAHKPARHQIPFWLQPMWLHSWPSGQTDLGLCLHNRPRYILPKVDPSKKKVIAPIVINFPEARRHKS